MKKSTAIREIPVQEKRTIKKVDISSFLTDESSLVKTKKIIEFNASRIDEELLHYFTAMNQLKSDTTIFLDEAKITSLKIESNTNIDSENELNTKVDSLLNLMHRSFATSVMIVR